MSPLYTYNGKLLIKDGALATSQSCCCGGQCLPSSSYSALCASINIQSGGRSLQRSGNIFVESGPAPIYASWFSGTNPDPDEKLYSTVTIRCTDGIITLSASLCHGETYTPGLPDCISFLTCANPSEIQFPVSSLIGTHTISMFGGFDNDNSCDFGTITVTFSNPPC